ncbi:MAG: DUF4190 domain-containing protein [Bacteroidota bacterium]|nr:DUF4190 domain-containing protein [Bacteroidota bacterium]
MDQETSIFDQPRQYPAQQVLPNATAVLVLGILSLVLCFIGVVLGIIGLVLANKDLRLYRMSPELYTAGSYNNLKAGRTCAIIGLVLQSLFVIGYIAWIVFVFAAFSNMH